MEIKVYEVNAFTDKLPGGNPAGVVLDSGKLSGEEMQSISREINLSETAFVEMIEEDYFKVRFFTPLCEVDLCGHATIAAFYLLGQMGYIKAEGKKKKLVYQETKAGKLEVELYFEKDKIKEVLMEQSRPRKLGIIGSLDRLANIMGIRIEDIGIEEERVYPEIVSTGLKDIIVPIKTKETLDNLNINMEGLKKYSQELKVVGIHAFYLPKCDSKDVYTRNFAPAVGIDEESATGTSNGALIFFLKDKKLIKGNNITSHQGENMGRPSQIQCKIIKENDVYAIKVGGKAVIINSRIINI